MPPQHPSGRVRRGDYISLFNLKREEAVCGRHYPIADERNAYRFGWDLGVQNEELDPNSHSFFTYPNATSAGYWEGRAYREEINSD